VPAPRTGPRSPVHALHEADAEGLGRVDPGPGQDHLERLAATHEPRQPLRPAAARDDREVDLGEAELGVLAGDPDVARQRQLEPAPSAKPRIAAMIG